MKLESIVKCITRPGNIETFFTVAFTAIDVSQYIIFVYNASYMDHNLLQFKK